MATLAQLGNSLGQMLQDVGTYSAKVASQANSVSKQAQSAQAAFNANAMNTANSITDNRIQAQYGFNSAMMQESNRYNTEAWERAAEWNEMMWQKQADFNAEQAGLQRQWQEKMANTSYQRAITDMQKAGLNPILAVNGGAAVPGGAAASVGGAQMSSAQSNMATGGVTGAESSSINNYGGQMESLTGMLGLLAALTASANSAQTVVNVLGEGMMETADSLMTEGQKGEAKDIREGVEKMTNGDMSIPEAIEFTLEHRPGSMLMRGIADKLPDSWNPWKEESSGRGSNHGSNRAESNQYARNMSAYKSWEKYSKPKG